MHLALRGRKCFYIIRSRRYPTQKYADLVAATTAHTVGLLTGDNSINGDAPVVVMTPRCLRNMLYTGSQALAAWVMSSSTRWYPRGQIRGAVWEEVIIDLPNRCGWWRCRDGE